MYKKLLLALLFFFLLPSKVLADKNFDISTLSTYNVSSNGSTTVSQKVAITNKTEFYYSPSYSISIGIKDVENIRVFNSDGAIPFTIKDTDDGKEVTINFNKKIVGEGRTNSFTFSFTSNEISKKQGNVWEINIPGIANPDNFKSYDTHLIVPKSFGPPNIIKPEVPIDSTQSEFNFTKNQTERSGIFILFGDAQYYSLNLTYHLENNNLFPIKTEVALPPATPYQEVLINKLDPKPTNVYQDADGNWLATYQVGPNKQKKIVAEVYVKVKAEPEGEEDVKDSHLYTKEAPYWDVNNSKIEAIAKQLSSPREVYNYVVNSLSYNYSRVANDNVRLGAKKTLENPTDAVCLEFTDLFVSLARASGIPARAVEGYAFTSNSKLRPLSLIKDVLHAWPEYYDPESKSWKMIDPTWGNTTSGMDYFDSLDYDHIVFAVKGKNSIYPVPAGGYKIDKDTQDVKVSFLDPDKFKPRISYELLSEIPKFALSGLPVSGAYIVKNTGNVILENKEVTLTSSFSTSEQKFATGEIPPFGEKKQKVDLGKTSFLTNKSYKVKINSNNLTLDATIFVGVIPNYAWIIVGGVIIFGVIFIPIAAKARSILVQRRKQEDTLRGKSKEPQEAS